MLFFLLSSAPERALGWPVFSFFFIFFFTTIVLGLLGSAIVVISRGVGDLLREVCLLFGVRSDPDSTSGGVARQHTRVRSGATPPVLRWWLDHGPYLADGPLESPDSEAYLKTCDGEEATVLPDPEELSGGYILDASPASEVCSPDLTLAATLLSAIEESTEGYDSDAESSAFEEYPVGWEKWCTRPPLSPLPSSSAPSPSVPSPLAPSPASCEEFVSGYDSDAESSAFEEYPVGWEKWCVRPPVPPPPPSYAPYPDGLIY
ncbi:hypothetical protein L873DRAFT_1925031 [Choiromyces venosus 120613-1]|uniref:Uncharacterized protein n=1 Tax=Choiromyces venosus 120613-1 TaxID=1336337 RepID=A0A3N4JJ70_9PEZI|nr:hypothetical protein L873DRAFT_1925031 [Choiromyces venosus 120613-1]